jgi:hypothetical protein
LEHEVAAFAAPVLVAEPLGHSLHALLAMALNLPTGHRLQLLAPTASKVLVNEPALHREHATLDDGL